MAKQQTRPRRIAARVEFRPNDNTNAVVGKPHVLTTCRGECRLSDEELAALVFSGQQAHQQSKWQQVDRPAVAAIEAEAAKLAEEEKARRAGEGK